jgi:formyltetrahydrofolate-dependent phosphoribosylglycinamide formyltransferase
MPRARVGVLISGRGSNMAALIAAAASAGYPAEIACVFSNRADAAGLAAARAAGIAAETVLPRDHAGRDAFDAALARRLEAHGCDLVALAGYMRVLGPAFLARFPGRTLNIHPSLLPAFPGLDTHARALAAGVRIHGCTVHFVDAGLDTGPIIAQAAVAVPPGDDEAALAARVLVAEHKLYPAALAAVARGDVTMIDGKAVWSAPRLAAFEVFSPNV